MSGSVEAADRVWKAAREVVFFDNCHQDGMDRAAFHKGEAIDELRDALAVYDDLLERTALALVEEHNDGR